LDFDFWLGLKVKYSVYANLTAFWLSYANSVKYWGHLPKAIAEAYISMMSLMRTLKATSADGCRFWLFSLDGAFSWFPLGIHEALHTSVITSLISAGFNFNGCCSLFKKHRLM
jgi:hypothetical protein